MPVVGGFYDFRQRDSVILVKGEAWPVSINASMANAGWKGGQGVKWTAGTQDNPTVTLSDGLVAGFMLWGSNEVADQYTAMTQLQPAYMIAVLGVRGWLIMTTTFEAYTYASRQAGPLVPITYNANDKLLFSLRGYWTKEDEWTLSGDPRAPNTRYTGFVCQVPTAETDNYMTIQTSL